MEGKLWHVIISLFSSNQNTIIFPVTKTIEGKN